MQRTKPNSVVAPWNHCYTNLKLSKVSQARVAYKHEAGRQPDGQDLRTIAWNEKVLSVGLSKEFSHLLIVKALTLKVIPFLCCGAMLNHVQGR